MVRFSLKMAPHSSDLVFIPFSVDERDKANVGTWSGLKKIKSRTLNALNSEKTRSFSVTNVLIHGRGAKKKPHSDVDVNSKETSK